MKLARSLVVGVVATLLDLALLHLLVTGGLAPTVANVPSLLLGVTAQFLGNKYWAFRDVSTRLLEQSALFAAVEAGTFVLNALAFHALAAWLRVAYWAARPLGTFLVYALFSYPLWARIFRRRPELSSPGARPARGSRPPRSPAPAARSPGGARP
ncbi:MAG TPA: GtrA family protein [Planctomycetota bacterium]|nr:GtrA family protein [Planctomycetota bacterium]